MIQSTRVLWLVRHGESTWNTLGLAQGHCDQARLTRLGQRQAWAVAAQLRGRPVAALYASDLRRALETAAPLAEVTGLTMVIDGGIPVAHFADLVSSAAEYIDFVKFGWGTAVVTAGLQAKIDMLAANGIGFYFGGTLFEKYLLQGLFDDYRKC